MILIICRDVHESETVLIGNLEDVEKKFFEPAGSSNRDRQLSNRITVQLYRVAVAAVNVYVTCCIRFAARYNKRRVSESMRYEVS